MKRTIELWFAGAALLLTSVLGLAFFATRAPAPYHTTIYVFGSVAELELRGVESVQASSASAAIGQLLAGYDRDWHPWQPGALQDLNDALAKGRALRPADSILGLLRRAQDLATASDGLFDPAVGGLVALWGYHSSDYPLTSPPPADDQVDLWLASRPRLADLRIDPDGRVSASNPAMRLDFNAIAEGYAAEQIALELKRRAITDAIINLGGDVLALGSAGARPWRVAIRHPDGSVLGGVELSGHEALFSSGNYTKFREFEGKRYAHILDPRNGRPVAEAQAVSVLHPDAVVADAAATALMVAGPREFVRIARQLKVSCALLLTADGRLLVSATLAPRLTLAPGLTPTIVAEPAVANCAAAP